MSSLRAPLTDDYAQSERDFETGSSPRAFQTEGNYKQSGAMSNSVKYLLSVLVVLVFGLAIALAVLGTKYNHALDTPPQQQIVIQNQTEYVYVNHTIYQNQTEYIYVNQTIYQNQTEYVYVNQTIYQNQTEYIYVNQTVEVPGEDILIWAQTEALLELGNELDSSRDLTADPCEDFYQYACGGWVNKTVLGNASSITKGFTGSAAVNARYVRDILNDDWPIITPFFESCMDTASVDKLGPQPVKQIMDLLNPKHSAIRTMDGAFNALGSLRSSYKHGFLFTLALASNSSNPRQAVLAMGVGGFTVSSWRIYASSTPALESGVAAMFQAVGDMPEDAAAFAKLAINFEAKLINITQRSQIRLTDPITGTERDLTLEEIQQQTFESEGLGALDASMSDLQQLMPNIPVDAFLKGTGVTDTLAAAGVPLNVQFTDLQYNQTFGLVNQLIVNTNVSQLLAYARWRVLNESSAWLSTNILSTRALHFDPLFDGVDAVVDRYPYCSNLVVNQIPDLFGRYFVERRLPEAVKNTARNLITWIKQAFERNLPDIDWMDDPTRKLALEKAQAVAELVGGPENGNWSDYSEVWMKRNTLYANWYQIQAMNIREDWKMLTQPRSRFAFIMNPSIVNAAYVPSNNAMVFPAGILQPPFFAFEYPMSVNLGRIGMVMGHELLHGFDNSGRQYDKDGNRRQWWDNTVINAFNNKTFCMIEQYSNITVQGSKVSGTRTLGENIADNGGIHMAYLAYVKYTSDLRARNLTDPVPTNTKAPLTGDQLFYWAHAQTWCTKATDRAIASQVLSDVHAPGEARVWAPLVNQDEFAKAFNCKVGQRMNPPKEKKCYLY